MLSVSVLLYPLSYTQMRGTVCVQRVLNSSIAFSGGLLSPISPCFASFSPFLVFAEWVPLRKKHALSVPVIPHLVSAEIPFTWQPWNSAGSFVLFFDKDSHLGTGLCFDRQRWGGVGRREGEARWWAGGWSSQKIPRVSNQSDENILNANGGKLPRVKLNSGQSCRKMHREERGVPPMCIQCANVFCL